MTELRRARLERILSPDGRLRIAALDHRDSLRVEFGAPDDPNGAEVPAETLTGFKADVMAGLGDRPSGVMLEPEYSLPQLRAVVPAGVGVIGALEAQGYFDDPAAGNQLAWDPADAVAAGVDCAKLLVLYRPDRTDLAAAQDALIADAVERCHAVDLPILVEPVPFDVVDAADRLACIVGAAERCVALGIDLLKAPFPGHGSDGADADAWPEACRRLDEVAAGTPWGTLSWGVGFDVFARQLAVACDHGCSGFLVGRAMWRPALDPASRADAMVEVRNRFDQLASIADHGRPVVAVSSSPGGD